MDFKIRKTEMGMLLNPISETAKKLAAKVVGENEFVMTVEDILEFQDCSEMEFELEEMVYA